jgi:GNAT superfamily N-acetyltransferase
MYKLRAAVIGDEEAIARQRCRMFQDNGLTCANSWASLERASIIWLTRQLEAGSYIGWLVEEEGHLLAGAGVWFMEWPPHILDDAPLRGYLLNFYVAPEARGRGIATALINAAISECKLRQVRVAVLHASEMGIALYRKMGWEPSNEMMLTFKDASP